MVEATSTVITDTPTGEKIPRKLVALVLCGLGAALSFIFCFNWGYTYFDVVDHYLSVYLLLFLGVFQCFGAGWVYNYGESVATSGSGSTMVLFVGFWGSLILLCFSSTFFYYDQSLIAMAAFWIIQIVCWIVSFVLSKQKAGDWYRETLYYGVYRLGCAISLPSCTNGVKAKWVEPFIMWWGFCIKYFFPFGVTWLLALGLKADLDKAYGGYYWGW
jgi:hypothetical protein